jgi:hypothetical protein
MMLILQLKKRIEILEAKANEQEQKINDLLIRLSVPTAQLPSPTKEKKSTFKKPTVVEIYEYACEKLSNEDALKFTEKFHAHYEANGWKVGRNAMKDWKAAVRKWDLSTFVTTNQNTKIKNGKFDSDAAQRIYADAHNYTKG